MYETHPKLDEPEDTASLWRYMDFQKFFAILENKALHFTRLTCLDDPFEGQLTRQTVEAMRTIPDNFTQAERHNRKNITKHNLKASQSPRSLSDLTYEKQPSLFRRNKYRWNPMMNA